MADVATLKRIAHQLEQTAGTTPAGEGYWPTLAQVAASAMETPPQVAQAVLPTQPFLAMTRSREGLQLLARAALFADLTAPVTAYLTEQGAGEVLLCEIRRVLVVT